MKRLNTYFALALTIPFLAACAAGPDLAPTKRMASKGDLFQQALHREYLALAQAEQDEADGADAEFFNNKAVASAMAKKVGPQAVKERKLPGDTKWELEAARQALRAALGATGTKKAPNQAARAQAMFDCWMQEQEENFQPDHIARCKNAFDEALKVVEAEISKRPMKKAMAKPKPKRKKKAQEFIIYFGHNSAKLDQAGLGVVDRVAKMTAKVIVVSGHTDTSGSAKYNAMLAEKRANVVAGALKAAGVKEYKVFVQTFGEDELAKATGDNVRETLNRRVTLVVQ